MFRSLHLLFFLLAGAWNTAAAGDVLARENLMAWCIVPFDAMKRAPEERAQMLARLGIKKLACDYRTEHIPTFEAEIDALQKHGLELTAWWFPGVKAGVPKTGTENFGGAMVTAGGLVFVSGTRDKKLRAFDAESGAELWQTTLSLYGTAPPASYEVNGRQFIVLPVSGGGKLGGPAGDAWMPFALPVR